MLSISGITELHNCDTKTNSHHALFNFSSSLIHQNSTSLLLFLLLLSGAPSLLHSDPTGFTSRREEFNGEGPSDFRQESSSSSTLLRKHFKNVVLLVPIRKSYSLISKKTDVHLHIWCGRVCMLCRFQCMQIPEDPGNTVTAYDKIYTSRFNLM